jgi:hypothetical protein
MTKAPVINVSAPEWENLTVTVGMGVGAAAGAARLQPLMTRARVAIKTIVWKTLCRTIFISPFRLELVKENLRKPRRSRRGGLFLG